MIERTVFKSLVEHLPRQEISLITGPRQAGKTTLMEMLRRYLDKKGERTTYLNLDVEWDRPHLASHAALVDKLGLELGKNRGFVFIDEIQRKENAGLFLKGIYDLKLPHKFIVSGSGSLELKEKIHESLVGRKRLFELSTLTFEEFVQHKTSYKYRHHLADFFKVERERVMNCVSEYMNYGGYPRIVLEPELKEKVHVMDDIYRSVLERDIAYLLKVDKTESFTELIKVISSQVGNLINYSELSSTLHLSHQSVKKYLWYAQKIFLIDIVTPYFKNIRKEISRSPVIYFGDLGFRNYALGLFGNLSNPAERGFVFENLVYLLLKKQCFLGTDEVHFWRTKDRAEVDFVLERGGRRIIPVECKYKSLKREEVSRSFHSFIGKYRPEKAYVVNLDYRGASRLEDTAVYFLPFWELLFRDL